MFSGVVGVGKLTATGPNIRPALAFLGIAALALVVGVGRTSGATSSPEDGGPQVEVMTRG